ncbi:hypothetical protein DFH05DRAFT_1498894 [Lentinula detonsa]|uniref:Uncharacterized protein n=1 Tax=Lentinula detonsa TaxID=2804962 RepID=A0A9W8NXX3_9AGAR|nr:hypothetical protein DFH05DRAFT_1498894 [Lentinula detonsa]
MFLPTHKCDDNALWTRRVCGPCLFTAVKTALSGESMMMGGAMRDEGGPRCVSLSLMSSSIYLSLFFMSSHFVVDPFIFLSFILFYYPFVCLFGCALLMKTYSLLFLFRCPICRALIQGWDGKGGGLVRTVVQVVVTA